MILNTAVIAFKRRLWGKIFRENRKLPTQACLVSTHYRWPPPFNSLTPGLQIFFPTPPLGPLLSCQVSLTIVHETTQSKAGFWIRDDWSQIQNTTSATTKLRFKSLFQLSAWWHRLIKPGLTNFNYKYSIRLLNQVIFINVLKVFCTNSGPTYIACQSSEHNLKVILREIWIHTTLKILLTFHWCYIMTIL